MISTSGPHHWQVGIPWVVTILWDRAAKKDWRLEVGIFGKSVNLSRGR